MTHDQNTNQKTKTFFHPLVVTIALAVIFFVTNSATLIQAQPAYPGGSPPSAPPEDASGEQLNNLCQVELGEYFKTEMANFRQFLETTFQNKSSTISLLETAFARYGELRTAAMNKYATYFPQQGALLLTEGLQPGACMAIVEKNLKDAQRLLESRARSTSAVKKTTALISKYQEINNQLRTLNQSFITMKAYLDTFATKLPCYVKKSCNKG